MKLWLISQSVNSDWDSYDSAVVVAETEEAARIMSPDHYRVWRDGSWHFKYAGGTAEKETAHSSWSHPDNVKVELLGEAVGELEEGTVVCASFNAG